MLPPKISTRLRGCRESNFKWSHTSEALGRSFWAANRRQRGTAKMSPSATPTTMTTMTMSHTRWALPLLSLSGSLKWRLPRANGRAMRNSPPFTIQLAVLTSTPELTAMVGVYPSCWKNLTRVASTAIEPPARPTKVSDSSRATVRP
jgi:hypothetical protein